jgi:hypothetical protein
MSTAFDHGGTHDPLRSPTRQVPAPGWHRFAVAWSAAGMLAAAAAWWFAPLNTPDTRASQFPGRRMHVAEIQPTDATFHEPQRSFARGSAYWRVRIVDGDSGPIADAHVTVDVIGPDRAVGAHLVANTAANGQALFSYALGHSPLTGVYTVRVVDVSHPDPDAIYDRAANGAWANSFSVAAPAPRPTTPLRLEGVAPRPKS